MVKPLESGGGEEVLGQLGVPVQGRIRGLRGLWSRVLNSRRLVRTAQAVLNRAHGTADLDIDECSSDGSRGVDENCGSATTVMAWPGLRLLTWWSQVVTKAEGEGREREIEAWEVGRPSYEKGERERARQVTRVRYRTGTWM